MMDRPELKSLCELLRNTGNCAGRAGINSSRLSTLTTATPRARHVPDLRTLETISQTDAEAIAAVVMEPLIQGAAGMRVWPPGTLRGVRGWCDRTGALLVVDEVMTGF